MKKTRFTEEQMVTILREADRRPVPEVAKQHGVSAQTIYSWRKHFGTLEPADVKRFAPARARERAAEEAGRRSGSRDRRAQGDHQKQMVGARVRRQQVAYARRRGLSSRRACALLSVARIDVGLYVWVAATRCAGAGGHAGARRPVSPVRLPEDPDLSRPAWPCHECGPGVSSLAPGRVASAPAPPAPPGGIEPPTPRAAHGEESRVGLRFHLRYVCRWTVAEMSHGHRRVHARMFGH